MRLTIVTENEAFRALEEEWDRLVEESEEDAIFRTWEWAWVWWHIYGQPRGAALHIVVLREEDGTLLGLAPLYLGKGPFSPRARVLRFLGSGGDTSPDYLGLLTRPGQEMRVAQALAAYLRGNARPRWDALFLTDLAEGAASTGALFTALSEGLWPLGAARQIDCAICPHIELAPSWEEFFENLPRKLRYNIRSRRKKLSKEHQARFFRWEEQRDIQEGIERLAFLHQKRFQARGEAHSFSSAEYLQFHKEVAERFHHRGRLRLYSLEAGGEVVAMLYCFCHKDRIYHFQSGFDPDWSQFGVGQVLISYALEDASREKIRRFDFLKGEYRYKEDFATGKRRTVCLTAGRPTPQGFRHLYQTFFRPQLGRFLRGLRK